MQTETYADCDNQLKAVVARLLKEDDVAEHERRSIHRIPLVRPVTIRVTGQEKEVTAFSKNISPLGIGLITEEALVEGTIAKLTIHSLSNKHVHIRSEVRWCRPFGNGWSLTGWKFIAEVR